MTNDPNGWPERPGVPMNPERTGAHQVGRYIMLWRASEPGWFNHNGNPCPIKTAALLPYYGPCLTPKDIAARVEEARAKALEEAAAIAEGNVYLSHYRTWPWWVNPDGTEGNRSNDSDIVQHCDNIAAAIRALKDNQVKPWLSTDAQAEFKTLPEINGPKDYTQEIKD